MRSATRAAMGNPRVHAARDLLYRRQWSLGRCHATASTSAASTVLRSSKWSELARASADTGENQTGHIEAGLNEGVIFFDNLSPLFAARLNWLTKMPWMPRRSSVAETLERYRSSTLNPAHPLNLVKRAIPPDANIEIIEILPRVKDAGCFVKFVHSGNNPPKAIEEKIWQHLQDNPVTPWFNPFSSISAHLVRGKPWLEDLYRLPRHTLKVEFVSASPEGAAAELSQETLFELFRRYGKLADIVSQPSESKIIPRHAFVKFSRIRSAIVAQNCMHGFLVGEQLGGGTTGTILRLSFERKNRGKWFWDWFVNHPRVTIPLLAAFIATVTVTIFDPIRRFSVKTHIDKSYRITSNRVYQWFKSQANDILTFRHQRFQSAGLKAIWEDRKKAIAELTSWLLDPADTFIVIQGPRGSGKRELVMDFALKDRENVLYIDCKPIQEARGDSATISTMARSVGYRPIFSWMNSMSSWIDLAAQGTIGVKSGFSETLDSQLAKILQSTAGALKEVALSDRNTHDADASLAPDEWLEAHPEIRPVVVIDNFLHKNEESSVVYDKISEWAAGLTSSNLAHVIFLTTDSSFSKPLGKALPDRVFRTVALGDLSAENARQYVVNHLQKEAHASDSQIEKRVDSAELDESIALLGGRLTDLEFFARRLKTGQSPRHAVNEIIEQNANEVLKIYLLSIPDTSRKWSTEQAWYLISALAKSEVLNYNEVLLCPTFTSSLSASTQAVTAIEALAAMELVSIKSHKGRPHSLVTGKPVYHAAFRMLAEDHVLKCRFELALVKELAGIEAKSIQNIEEELSILGRLPKQTKELSLRIQYLLGTLESSQMKIENYERAMGRLKKGMVEKLHR